MAGQRLRYDRRVTRVTESVMPLYGPVLLVMPAIAGATAYALFAVILGCRGHDGCPHDPAAAVATLAGI